MNIKIETYRKLLRQELTHLDDGSIRAKVFAYHGQIDLFVYPGGVHGKAFTRLAVYFGGKQFHCTLPRAYHRRWFGRLALQFDWECWNRIKSDLAP